MKNYPLIKTNKEGTLLRPQHSYYSDEYTESMCDLFLRTPSLKTNMETAQVLSAPRKTGPQYGMAFATTFIARIATAVC